jgi:serine/threonine protein kinase
VLRGIRYLHLHKVLHRDVKPMNILISLQYRCAKLCDLGMARIDTGDKGVIFWTDYVATRWCDSAVSDTPLTLHSTLHCHSSAFERDRSS